MSRRNSTGSAKGRRLIGAAVAACFVVSPVARADEPAAAPPTPASPSAAAPADIAAGAAVTIRFQNGDVLKGTYVCREGDAYIITHGVLGRLVVPRSEVVDLIVPARDERVEDVEASADENIKAFTRITLEQPTPGQPAAGGKPTEPQPGPAEKSFFAGWKGSVELGLNGSEGNTTRLNLRAGVHMERKTEKLETKLGLVYSYGRDESMVTEDRARFDIRNDWLTGTRWRFFAQGAAEYDDFQDWDVRLSAFVGVGYEFIKAEKDFLLGRVGIGISREIGGSDNTIRPEALIGADYEHKFTDTQKFTFSIDVYPDLADIGGYRLTAKAAYEILIDPKSAMTLKLGAVDNYDSTPNGRKRNDLDYFALLVFNF